MVLPRVQESILFQTNQSEALPGSRLKNESFGVNDSDWAAKARKSVRRDAEHSRPVFACGYERGTKMPALPIFQIASSAICENPEICG
jgi:hypothetical protein